MLPHYYYYYYYYYYMKSYTSQNLAKLEVRICGNVQKKQSKNRVIFNKKTEMSLVMWLNIVTIVAQSVRLLPARIR